MNHITEYENDRRQVYVEALQGARRKLFDAREQRLQAENKSFFFAAKHNKLNSQQQQLEHEIVYCLNQGHK